MKLKLISLLFFLLFILLLTTVNARELEVENYDWFKEFSPTIDSKEITVILDKLNDVIVTEEVFYIDENKCGDNPIIIPTLLSIDFLYEDIEVYDVFKDISFKEVNKNNLFGSRDCEGKYFVDKENNVLYACFKTTNDGRIHYKHTIKYLNPYKSEVLNELKILCRPTSLSFPIPEKSYYIKYSILAGEDVVLTIKGEEESCPFNDGRFSYSVGEKYTCEGKVLGREELDSKHNDKNYYTLGLKLKGTSKTAIKEEKEKTIEEKNDRNQRLTWLLMIGLVILTHFLTKRSGSKRLIEFKEFIKSEVLKLKESTTKPKIKEKLNKSLEDLINLISKYK